MSRWAASGEASQALVQQQGEDGATVFSMSCWAYRAVFKLKLGASAARRLLLLAMVLVPFPDTAAGKDGQIHLQVAIVAGLTDVLEYWTQHA